MVKTQDIQQQQQKQKHKKEEAEEEGYLLLSVGSTQIKNTTNKSSKLYILKF